MSYNPDIFEKAFTSGYAEQVVFEDDPDTYDLAFFVHTLGDLKLPTGKIIACDAFVTDELSLAVQFPKGNFPTELAVARINDDDERVAFARIRFTDKPAVRWELAIPEGENADTLEEGEIFGFPVDSGTACFMDEIAFDAWEKANADAVTVEQLLRDNEKDTWTKLLYETGETNVAVFSSGVGDGLYASYIGYDAENHITTLLTDFYLIPWDDEA